MGEEEKSSSLWSDVETSRSSELQRVPRFALRCRCTSTMKSQTSAQPSTSWKLSAKSVPSGSVQTISVSCCRWYTSDARIVAFNNTSDDASDRAMSFASSAGSSNSPEQNAVPRSVHREPTSSYTFVRPLVSFIRLARNRNEEEKLTCLVGGTGTR